MSVFALVMMGAGTLGVQRRHWDMAFTNSALAFDYPASAYTLMGLVGISGTAAVVGGAMYILIVVWSVFLGKPVASVSAYGAQPTVLLRAVPTFEVDHGKLVANGKWGFAAPGTFVLALFFLAVFVVYYAINWKYLASVWPLS